MKKTLFILAVIAASVFIVVNNFKKDDAVVEQRNENVSEVAQNDTEKEINDASGVKDDTLEDNFYLRSNEQVDELISNDKPTIIMFGAKWCHYCKQMRPYVRNASENRTDIDIKYVDIDTNPEISKKYPIQGTPAMMYFLPEKKPYIPSDKYKKYAFFSFNEKGKSGLGLVMSYGKLEEEIFNGIIDEMVSLK